MPSTYLPHPVPQLPYAIAVCDSCGRPTLFEDDVAIDPDAVPRPCCGDPAPDAKVVPIRGGRAWKCLRCFRTAGYDFSRRGPLNDEEPSPCQCVVDARRGHVRRPVWRGKPYELAGIGG